MPIATTKGPAISFRLSLEDDRLYRKIAQDAGMSPGLMAAHEASQKIARWKALE